MAGAHDPLGVDDLIVLDVVAIVGYRRGMRCGSESKPLAGISIHRLRE
jgi:hypothetical protein